MSGERPFRSLPRPEDVRRALVDLLGEDRVHEERGLDGVFVASAVSVDDVQGVLAVARRHRIPLLARPGDLDTSRLTAPAGGGILLDVGGMNRVLEVNHSERYALVEPGVTWRRLQRRLDEDGHDLALPTAAVPRGLTIWSSAVLGGTQGLSLAHGALGESVWGIEAVTAEGELVRSGSGSMGGAESGWWGRGPLPDLTGLFLGWRGATGVITRLAVSLRPRKRYLRRLLFPATTRRTAIAGAVRAAREGLFDEATVLSWALPRLLLGVRGPLVRHPGEPEAYLHIDFTADTRPELEYKRLRLANALNRATRRGGAFDEPLVLEDLAGLAPALSSLHDLPLRLPPPLEGERWSFLGGYGPTSRLVDGAERVEGALRGRELPTAVLIRIVQGGHYGLLHAFAPVRRHADKDLARVLDAQREALEEVLSLGFVPHRFAPELGEQVYARVHGGSHALTNRVRALLDPDALLDPGRWGLPVPA